ncbi:MAG: hypothetical protein R2855_04875 [Thermomicrobiales bacterium]
MVEEERALVLGDAIDRDEAAPPGTQWQWFLFHMGEIDRAMAMLLIVRARANVALSDPLASPPNAATRVYR